MYIVVWDRMRGVLEEFQRGLKPGFYPYPNVQGDNEPAIIVAVPATNCLLLNYIPAGMSKDGPRYWM